MTTPSTPSSTPTSTSRFIELPENIELVASDLLNVLLATISDAITVKAYRKKYGNEIDGPNRLLAEFADKNSKLQIEVHQVNLAKVQDLLKGGFAEPSITALIALQSEVDTLNETLPDTPAMKLRVPDITRAVLYQAAAKRHGPIIALSLIHI